MSLPSNNLSDTAGIFSRVAVLLGLHTPAVRVGEKRTPLILQHIAPVAQPFVVAALVQEYSPHGNIWVVCENERDQERMYAELATWVPGALSFPHLEVAAVEGALPDPETFAERLSVLQTVSSTAIGCVVVLNKDSFGEKVFAPEDIGKLTLEIVIGQRLEREQLQIKLSEAGYENVSQVTERGHFTVRGGLMDIYSWQLQKPVRIEWFDDEIVSLREFDLDEQISVRTLSKCSLVIAVPESTTRYLHEFQKKSDVVVSVGDVLDKSDIHLRNSGSAYSQGDVEDFSKALFESPFAASTRHFEHFELREAHEKRVEQQVEIWLKESWTVITQYAKPAEIDHIQLFAGKFTRNQELLKWRLTESKASFVFPAAKLALTTTNELFRYSQIAESSLPVAYRNKRGLTGQRKELDYADLKNGALVVHLEHGLARYRGIEEKTEIINQAGERALHTEEHMILEFADEAKLFVPLEQAYFVSRYVGIGKRGAALSKLGDGKWTATKKAAEKSIYDYAAKLLKVQALRETRHGHAFRPDGGWQKEFEEAFPYRETPDQIRAIADTKRDMESDRPMDRLICGDVGFGKTEVAIRAAFKAVNDGVQVAMMVPTTVLAQQHYENFRARMANFPLRVELLSRYRTAAEQAKVALGLADGSVDLVIGTHRLISKDVAFRNLGLLVVDEEQRFGVKHKERIKEHFPGVDVLTLSATPIPRTLYLALTGARDLSTLETAPPSRFPVETLVCPYDERIIRAAIDRELDRQGQVYFLHNRVETIEKVAARVSQLCPRAKVDIGHGQMQEGRLEEVMHRFVSAKTDVLVATTIIESGLDIPNANTIIIDRADRFGLADLYQLRGRVGRGQHKAYAYLMLPRDMIAAGEARKRINAIKQYSSLGAGFKIALRDLEIRGAGNILGLAQSGHLTAVGFELYCQLLRQAVSKLKGEKVRSRVEVNLRLDFLASSELDFLRRQAVYASASNDATGAPDPNVIPPVEPWPAYVPSAYLEDAGLRVQSYRQLAAVSALKDVDELHSNWRDRFGPLPEAAENLLLLSRLKVVCATARIEQIEVRDDRLMITRNGEYLQVGGRFPRLTSPHPADKVREIFSLIENL